MMMQDGTKKEIITKTPLIEKNKKFADYLESELRIMESLKGKEGIVECFGIREIANPLNKNLVEKHLVMEYCQYYSLHSLSMYTKPFEEAAAFVVIRQVALALKLVHQ